MNRSTKYLVGIGVLLIVLSLVVIGIGRPKLYSIPTDSMAPTIQKDDKIFCVRSRKPADGLARGTLVVFDASRVGLKGTYVERLIALPGDRIEVANGELTVNGTPLPVRNGVHSQVPAHVFHDMWLHSPEYPLTVPPGMLFVLGDNYRNSLDSRYYGFVPVDAVERIAVRRVGPLHRIGSLE